MDSLFAGFDDGIGFQVRDVQRQDHSFRLRGISERVLLMGGTVEIASERGRGQRDGANSAYGRSAMPGLAALAGVADERRKRDLRRQARDGNVRVPGTGFCRSLGYSGFRLGSGSRREVCAANNRSPLGRPGATDEIQPGRDDDPPINDDPPNCGDQPEDDKR